MYEEEERAWLDEQSIGVRSIYQSAAETWETGRGQIAAFQADTGMHADVVIKPWRDLPVAIRQLFAEVYRTQLAQRHHSAVIQVCLIEALRERS